MLNWNSQTTIKQELQKSANKTSHTHSGHSKLGYSGYITTESIPTTQTTLTMPTLADWMTSCSRDQHKKAEQRPPSRTSQGQTIYP